MVRYHYFRVVSVMFKMPERGRQFLLYSAAAKKHRKLLRVSTVSNVMCVYHNFMFAAVKYVFIQTFKSSLYRPII